MVLIGYIKAPAHVPMNIFFFWFQPQVSMYFIDQYEDAQVVQGYEFEDHRKNKKALNRKI